VLAVEREAPDPRRIPVRLLFTGGGDVDQTIIRIGTRSPASHAAIAFGHDGEQLLHAYEKGVMLEPRSAWLASGDGQWIVAEYLILPDVTDGFDRMFRLVGERYDLPGAYRIGVLRLLQILGSPIYNLGRTPDHAHTCARLIMLLDPLGAKIPEWHHIDIETVVPGDLLQAAAGPSFLRLR